MHRGRQIKELQKEEEFHEQIQVLQQQLQVQVQEKDAILATRQQEYEAITREKDTVIETKEKQLQQLNQQLAVSVKVTTQLQKTIQELQEENQQKLGKFQMVTQKGNLALSLCISDTPISVNLLVTFSKQKCSLLLVSS